MRRATLRLFLSLFFIAPTLLWAAPSTPKIRVRLASSLQSVQLKGMGMEFYLDGHKVRPLISSDVSEVQIERAVSAGKSAWRLRWNGQPGARTMEGEELEVHGLLLRMGALNLPRSVRFHRRSSSKIKFDLISSLNLETYLAGVLPSEMPPSWPKEALKAQAIAARSFAVVRMRERSLAPFDVEASVSDQAFEFSSDHVKKTKWNDKIQSVIQSTRGQVLVDGNKVVKAYYHSDCGGKTELATNVWGGAKGYGGAIVTCEHPQQNFHRWSFQISRDRFISKLKSFFKLDKKQKYQGVHVASLSPSGRINHLIVQFSGASLKLSAQELRRTFGFHQLKSTFFQIEDNGEKISFTGRGYGHGVGMCQYGARFMALQGKKAADIVEKYFPGTALKQLNRILMTSAEAGD